LVLRQAQDEVLTEFSSPHGELVEPRGRGNGRKRTMTELHKNLINGEWVGGEGADNINPSNTNEVVGTYARATAEDARNAIAAAKAAFPAWSRSGLLQRWEVLSKA